MLKDRVDERTHGLIEDGVERGREPGRQEGVAALLAHRLEPGFGSLPQTGRERLDGATAEELLRRGERLLTADTLEAVWG